MRSLVAKYLAGTALALACACTPALASSVTIGTALPNTGNAFPFESKASNYGNRYEQVYSAAAFSGDLNIGSITFYNTVAGSLAAGSLDTGTFNLFLSTTSASPATLSPVLTSNLGADNTLVYSGSLPSFVNHELTFHLSHAFAYDPAQGDLLLYITSPNGSHAEDGFMDVTNSGFTSRGLGNQPTVDRDYGLVTTVSSVPLPASAAMFGMALTVLGLAAAAKQKKRTA